MTLEVFMFSDLPRRQMEHLHYTYTCNSDLDVEMIHTCFIVYWKNAVKVYSSRNLYTYIKK